MATIRIPIFGSSGVPDTSGDVFVVPGTVAHANFTNIDDLVVVFNNGAAIEKLHCAFRVPKDFVGSPVLGWLWTQPTGTGNVKWESLYNAAASGESADGAVGDEVTPSVVTAPTAENWLETTHTITATLAVDDLVRVDLRRDPPDAGDSLAQLVIVHPESIFFEYADA